MYKSMYFSKKLRVNIITIDAFSSFYHYIYHCFFTQY